jgi:hypothetical protein
VTRVDLVIIISKESWEKGLCQNEFDVSKLGAYPFGDSLHKPPFLLQRLLQASIGSLWEVRCDCRQVSHRFLPMFGFFQKPFSRSIIFPDEAAQLAMSCMNFQLKFWECDKSGFQIVLWHNEDTF